MAVRIGHASIGESGKVKNGAAGDQTGKEVFIRNWYLHSKGWVVLRCKEDEKREKIAKAMEKACANNQIGYDQNQRDTLFNDVKNNGFDPSKTTKKVETDCSALVRVCIAYAFGKDVVGNIRTVTEPNLLTRSGFFTKYTADKYCKSSDYLMRGDILCTPVSGHTVIVLDNGAKVEKTATTAPATPATTDIDKIAQDVINGKYGSGAKRKAKLGALYETVQKRVNELLKKPATQAPSVSYFKKYTGTSGSIATALKSIGANSSFAYRSKIAKANGIKGYIGSAKQNTNLLSLLKQGKLIKP